MAGITSFGAYIPRLRLPRMEIYRNLGWYAPATVTVAQGERSFCNFDEDTLTMAVEAARDALEGKDRAAVRSVLLASTTLPFADRSNATVLKEALVLSDQVSTQDLGGSLRASTGALRLALQSAGADGEVLVAASDRRLSRPGSFYEMWYGDGAAAVTVGNKDVVAELVAEHNLSVDFVDHFRASDQRFDYTWEERWVRDEGISKIIPQAISELLQKAGVGPEKIRFLAFPCIFSGEHRALAKRMGFSPESLVPNLHEQCGDCGTAHPFLLFVYALERARPGDLVLLCGWGQGADAFLFRVTEKIEELPARRGLKGSLERKKTVESYTRFLLYRDLLEADRGIRGEDNPRTALSVLWRERKMLHGLVGGRCKKCGTVQFPLMDVCVNPDCRAHHSQEPHPLSESPARILSFTGDYLVFTPDPPAIYGMIEFAGGGRMLADFSDCELSDLKVGGRLRMYFRRRYQDKQRGFSGYFWKAVPEPEPVTIDFTGRVAVVTGAGGGLGRAYALELARRGAKVVVNDFGGARDGTGGASGPADKVVEEIKAAGGEAVAEYSSVATAEGGRAVIEKALKTYGRVDVVIHNAGVLRDRTFMKMSREEWEVVMGVHLNGALNVLQPAWGAMKEQGYGRVVLVVSAAGLFGNFGQANYAAAKLGLVGLMNVLKLEGERMGVKLNAVAPLAWTRLTEDVLPAEMKERLSAEKVVPLVVYLASEKCQLNGAIINAGGGAFCRTALLAGEGFRMDKPPSAEQLLANFEKLDSLSGAREFHDAVEFIQFMLSPPAEKPRAAAASGAGRLAEVFEKMPRAFLPEKAGDANVVFQFEITGPGGGSWKVEIAGGKIAVSSGRHDRPTTTIKMEGGDFLELIAGRLDAMAAYTSGKLKIEGDLMKSRLITKVFDFKKV